MNKQTVYVVVDKWDFAFNQVFSSKEKAAAYIDLRDKKLQKLLEGSYPSTHTTAVTANLIIEEIEVDLVDEEHL